MVVFRALRKYISRCAMMCRKMLDAHRGKIKQKSRVLVMETKSWSGFEWLLSAAAGPGRVAAMHNNIEECSRISVRTSMMRYRNKREKKIA